MLGSSPEYVKKTNPEIDAVCAYEYDPEEAIFILPNEESVEIIYDLYYKHWNH